MRYVVEGKVWLRPNGNGTLSVGVLDDYAKEAGVVRVSTDGHALMLHGQASAGRRARRVDVKLPVCGELVLMYEDVAPGRSNAYYRPGYAMDIGKAVPDDSGEEAK